MTISFCVLHGQLDIVNLWVAGTGSLAVATGCTLFRNGEINETEGQSSYVDLMHLLLNRSEKKLQL